MINLLNGKTVGDFFRNANWQGLPPTGAEKLTTPQEVSPQVSLSLTVERFFSLYNWNGKQAPSPPISPTILPLTMSVAEFFLRMGWYSPTSKPQSARETHDTPLNPQEWGKKQINVKDLSDLF
ncbi:MAG: hypothetical protein NZ901_10350 [Geminocystis sp.]|nr:hypothetical protein [Geminocystis sp.]HIK38747.1 hypothetical protein [Geminocystis sp. M7585_C2015_104]MCS7148575.1 hypothetical protein [Geminocystis sp.]MCX8078162.1 hypothetical protein [Geminocystis sp.]MDW8115033.1 hypothetical protein [Geminocystis sp.]